MLLSLSPGETPLAAAGDVARNANTWRISDDFWDTWPALIEEFGRLKSWSPYVRAGNWPDADMLPVGVLEMGRRTTRFTAQEQVALLTLWSITRSPLFMGGDLLSARGKGIYLALFNLRDPTSTQSACRRSMTDLHRSSPATGRGCSISRYGTPKGSSPNRPAPDARWSRGNSAG
jgi:hypothetical protein